MVDRRGTPLGLRLSPANRHDSVMLAATLDAVPGVRQGRGRPRKRPKKLHADKAYDHRRCRAECRARSIAPRIARRGVDSSEKLGRHRWVVERTFAWLNRMRRLTVRYERRADIHEALIHPGCALVCLNQIARCCKSFGLVRPQVSAIATDVLAATRTVIAQECNISASPRRDGRSVGRAPGCPAHIRQSEHRGPPLDAGARIISTCWKRKRHRFLHQPASEEYAFERLSQGRSSWSRHEASGAVHPGVLHHFDDIDWHLLLDTIKASRGGNETSKSHGASRAHSSPAE